MKVSNTQLKMQEELLELRVNLRLALTENASLKGQNSELRYQLLKALLDAEELRKKRESQN